MQSEYQDSVMRREGSKRERKNSQRRRKQKRKSKKNRAPFQRINSSKLPYRFNDHDRSSSNRASETWKLCLLSRCRMRKKAKKVGESDDGRTSGISNQRIFERNKSTLQSIFLSGRIAALKCVIKVKERRREGSN